MLDLDLNVYPILLAGGTGTRLWPVSRELYPKQLVKFIGDDSLLQVTIKRLAPVLDTENVKVVCGEQHFYETARHIENLGLESEGKLIREPSGRNTAPAILLAVLHILTFEKDAILCIFPADHVISKPDAFNDRLKAALKLAQDEYVVTFGIQPHYPETGYGYVEGGKKLPGDAFAIRRFVEKPDMPTAKKYIEAGNFFWNSGMFAFKASVILSEFKTYQPRLLSRMEALFKPHRPITREDYDQLTDISIDYAIMEKTKKGVVVPSDFGWSDIGSWKSLYDYLPKDENKNVIDGDVLVENTENCFILGQQRLVAVNHLQNLVVVETPDAIFVSDMEHSRDAKSIVNTLKKEGRSEYHRHQKVIFPWGNRTLLEDKDNVVTARLLLNPNASMELDVAPESTHHLLILSGSAKVSADQQDQILKKAQSATFTAQRSICIENTGKRPLSLITVQICDPLNG
jgi:mannose-1-phosphate guanylyltransferase/mannose-6-phosphate isomerase